MTIQKGYQGIAGFFQRSTGISGIRDNLIVRKSFNGAHLIVRRREADGGNADATEFIERGSSCGNPQVAPAHEGCHILYICVDMNRRIK